MAITVQAVCDVCGKKAPGRVVRELYKAPPDSWSAGLPVYWLMTHMTPEEIAEANYGAYTYCDECLPVIREALRNALEYAIDVRKQKAQPTT